jgi:hypothetical protein
MWYHFRASSLPKRDKVDFLGGGIQRICDWTLDGDESLEITPPPISSGKYYECVWRE